MEDSQKGYIELVIRGENNSLKPDNYDIKDLIESLQDLENLLYPEGKANREMITYQMEEGSVKHVLTLAKTTVVALTVFLTDVANARSLAPFSKAKSKQVEILEKFQKKAEKRNLEFSFLSSEHTKDEAMLYMDKETNYYQPDELWLNTEMHIYGQLIDAGGQNTVNIHLDTDSYGLLKIAVDKETLENVKENLLYKYVGLRASGKEKWDAPGVPPKDLQFIEWVTYNDGPPDWEEINRKLDKSTEEWAKLGGSEKWLEEIRGDEEEW